MTRNHAIKTSPPRRYERILDDGVRIVWAETKMTAVRGSFFRRQIAPGHTYFAHFERPGGQHTIYDFAEFVYYPGDPLHNNGRSTDRHDPAKMRQWIRQQGFKLAH